MCRSLPFKKTMDQTQLNWLTNFIWGIADGLLRDTVHVPLLEEISTEMLVIEKEAEGLRNGLLKIRGNG